MAAHPVFTEILDALVEELKKPDRDLAGITAWLASVVLDQTGMTLLDRVILIARSPERLAQASLKLIDPRLIAPEVWPGVRALLVYVKEQAQAEETKGGEMR